MRPLMKRLLTALRSPAAALSAAFLLVTALLGLAAPLLPLAAPDAVDFGAKFAPPSGAHWLGADLLGRDVLSRLIWGVRETLFTACAAMTATLTLGILAGGAAGAAGGALDRVLMRVADGWMSIPSEVMILALAGMLGPSPGSIVFACAAAKWPWYARMIRTFIRRTAQTDFVRFSRTAGVTGLRIFTTHLLPNAAGEVFVIATLDAGSVILMISTLSFLGLGAAAPSSEWGMMLADARNVMMLNPWQMLPPGLMILGSAAAFNFLGDVLRDAFDPQARTSSDALGARS